MQMEPMALGSPPSSPGSPQVNPNFLPAFLMGERQVQTTNRSANLSPTKTNRSFSYKSPSTEQRTPHMKMVNNLAPENSPFNVRTERTGPPALGLFDTLEHNDFTNPTRPDTFQSPTRDILPNRYPDTPNSIFVRNLNDTVDGTPNKSFQHNVSLQKNLNDSLSKNNSFRKQLEKNEELWVSIFYL